MGHCLGHCSGHCCGSLLGPLLGALFGPLLWPLFGPWFGLFFWAIVFGHCLSHCLSQCVGHCLGHCLGHCWDHCLGHCFGHCFGLCFGHCWAIVSVIVWAIALGPWYSCIATVYGLQLGVVIAVDCHCHWWLAYCKPSNQQKKHKIFRALGGQPFLKFNGMFVCLWCFDATDLTTARCWFLAKMEEAHAASLGRGGLFIRS